MKQISKKKTNSIILLYIIFIITVFPTIIIYIEHANLEVQAYHDAVSKTKQVKTFSEALLFYGIAGGYIITAVFIIFFPQYRIPYYVLLVGTVIVIIIYFFRIYGIPIPGTNIIITDFSEDWRDVSTKICQFILIIPVSMLLAIRSFSDIQINFKSSSNKRA